MCEDVLPRVEVSMQWENPREFWDAQRTDLLDLRRVSFCFVNSFTQSFIYSSQNRIP